MVLDVLDVLDASVLVLVLVQSSFRIPSHGWKRHRRQPVRLGQAAARAWVTRETSSGDEREAMAARMALGEMMSWEVVAALRRISVEMAAEERPSHHEGGGDEEPFGAVAFGSLVVAK